jgi:hypothetical protein
MMAAGLSERQWEDLAIRVAQGLCVDLDAESVEALALDAIAARIRAGLATERDSWRILERAGRRTIRGWRHDGAVVIFNSRIQGWVRGLDAPAHWVPGCFALFSDGQVFEAVGGDDWNGAAQWRPIDADFGEVA